METYKLVMPEHLNHYGYLFGGYLLKWVDEVAWIAATLEFPACKFVTIGMDKVEFRRSVRQGTILRFHTERARLGVTSADYRVDVWRDTMEGRQPNAAEPADAGSSSTFGSSAQSADSPTPRDSQDPSADQPATRIFTTTVTLVRVDEQGRKLPITVN